MIDNVKMHIKRHKVVYSIGTIIVVAGITCVIMRGRHASFLRSLDGPDMVTMRPLTFFSNRTQNIVNVFEREGRGHPGYLIECVETGERWISQAAAAIDAGTSAVNMSSHINGRFPDIYGLHYRRLAV